MRIEVEYRGEEGRWNWRVYADGTHQTPNTVVRVGQAREHDEACQQAQVAAGEYRSREVIQE